jgi:hypothetical protein
MQRLVSFVSSNDIAGARKSVTATKHATARKVVVGRKHIAREDGLKA